MDQDADTPDRWRARRAGLAEGAVMGVRRTFKKGLAVTGIAIGATVAARRAASRRAALGFYRHGLERGRPAWVGAGYGGPPIVYHRAEAIQSIHAASYVAVQQALPTDDLFPVRLPDGRAAVVVAGYQYREITANGVVGLAALPYAELMVAALVTRRPAPPLVPFVAPAFTGMAAGSFVLHMPVTTRIARDSGRIGSGFPKFVADIDIVDSLEEKRFEVAEGGRSILNMTVRPGPRASISGGRFLVYTVLDGALIEHRVPYASLSQRRGGRRSGYMELGDHQVADELRMLAIDPEPMRSMTYSSLRLALAPGEPIGRARQYLGYIGEDRDLGHYVVRYPDTAPIDQYAPYAPTAGPKPDIVAATGPTGDAVRR
jgi:hypothetical protein